jgi:NAD(P)-dependent dehydrogenase (short-subunit alcohol dehydrogenase family)
MEECVRRYGRLDFAFNNAGVGPDGKRVPLMDIVDCTEEIWDRTLDINLKGVFLCLKHEMRQMIAQGGGGVIVNTSSVGAVKPLPGFCAYSASKGGLNVLTKTAALEGAPHEIRVNTIMPGPTQNTLLFDYLTGTDPVQKANMEKSVPLGRLGFAADMAEAVIWLCSDAANFITGQCLAVDGGLTAR